jgi:hypothetical protein
MDLVMAPASSSNRGYNFPVPKCLHAEPDERERDADYAGIGKPESIPPGASQLGTS